MLSPPSLKKPGSTGSGVDEPAGQYSHGAPHSDGDDTPASQKKPAGHTPLHDEFVRPDVEPKRPATTRHTACVVSAREHPDTAGTRASRQSGHVCDGREVLDSKGLQQS